MRTRSLGSDGLSTSSLGLGCMGFSQAYGPADDEESIETLRVALELGVTLLDTAMSYGRGHNEELIGRAIAGPRDQVVLASRFGIVRGEDGVRIDGRPELVRGFRAAVRGVAVLAQVEDDVVPAARRLGVGLVPYSPLGRGMLTGALPSGGFPDGDFRGSDPRFQGEDLVRNLALVEAVRRLAADRGITAGQLALAWLLAQGPDVVPIPGTRRRDRLAENVAAADIELSEADLQQLEAAVPRSTWAGDRQSFGAHGTARTTA